MANLTAGLAKLGVAEVDTAKSTDFFIRAMKQTPAQANESIRSLEGVAHSLDVNVGQAFKDFVALQGDLSQFGDRTIEVFADLKTQSVATGIEVGQLAKVAQNLDTFKGAAKAAQGFNAILGDTVLSVTDLVHAEPAQKIELLKNAMSRSGITFDTAHRRVQQSIAAMVTGGDVGAARRLFGSSEDYYDIKSGVDTAATSYEELTDRAKSTMDVADKMKAKIGALGGGIQKILKRAHGEVDQAGTQILSIFKRIRKETKSSEEFLVSFMGQITLAGKAVAAAKTGVETGAGLYAGWQVIEGFIREGLDGSDLSKKLWEKELRDGRDYGTDASKPFVRDNWIGEPGAAGSRQTSFRAPGPGRRGTPERERTAAAPGHGDPGAPQVASAPSFTIVLQSVEGEEIDKIEVNQADLVASAEDPGSPGTSSVNRSTLTFPKHKVIAIKRA